MAAFIVSLLLASGYLVAEVFSRIHQNADSGCFHPFEPVGQGCIYFSEEHMNFQGAESYCTSLSQEDTQVSMAMLGYGYDADQQLLEAMMEKNLTFFVGGRTLDGVNWKWQDGRDVDIHAPYWHFSKPNGQGTNCLTAQGNANEQGVWRSSLYDYDCDASLNFVCQASCPFDFVRIDNRCYFLSEELGLEHITWLEARDYCQALSAPNGYHIDLAVLGIDNENTYDLMNRLTWGYSHITNGPWIGAYQQSQCNYMWIDGRSLPVTSMLWDGDEPDCDTYDYVNLYYNSGFNRTYLREASSSGAGAFICQMYKDA